MFRKSKAVQDIDELEARFFQKLPKALQLFPEPQPQKRGKGVQLDLVCVIPHKPPMQYWIFLGKPSTLSTPFITKDCSLAHWLWSYGHQRLNEGIRPRWSSPHLSYSSSFSPFPLQEVECQVTQPTPEGRVLLVCEKFETNYAQVGELQVHSLVADLICADKEMYAWFSSWVCLGFLTFTLFLS